MRPYARLSIVSCCAAAVTANPGRQAVYVIRGPLTTRRARSRPLLRTTRKSRRRGMWPGGADLIDSSRACDAPYTRARVPRRAPFHRRRRRGTGNSGPSRFAPTRLRDAAASPPRRTVVKATAGDVDGRPPGRFIPRAPFSRTRSAARSPSRSLTGGSAPATAAADRTPPVNVNARKHCYEHTRALSPGYRCQFSCCLSNNSKLSVFNSLDLCTIGY